MSLMNGITYHVIPKIMVVGFLRYVIKWMNEFSSRVAHPSVSPRNFLVGTVSNYSTHCNIAVGSYVQVPEDKRTMNSMDPRRSGAITLECMRGGYIKFMYSDRRRRRHIY